MKFVSQHLTREHLIHKPHRWFMAFLLSPIHVLELHYQKRYHLQFSHARKLFIFDMLLVLSIFVLAGLASFWYWYDPTITKFINLNITLAPTESNPDQAGRVLSGEDLTMTVSYQNNSPVDLINPVLHFNLPTGFILQRVTPGFFVTTTNSIILPNTAPKTGQEVTLQGQFFAVPNIETKFATELVYHQPGQSNYEVRAHSLLGITRGSVLQATATAPATIYAEGSWESQIVIKNIYRSTLPASTIQFTAPSSTIVQFKTITAGEIKNKFWQVPSLKPGASATSTVMITTDLPAKTRDFTLDFIPVITVNGHDLAQTPATITSRIVRPDLSISSAWEKSQLSPGQNNTLYLELKNTGDSTLHNLEAVVTLPGNKLWSYSVKDNPELTTLNPGENKKITLNLPTLQPLSNQTDVTLQLPIKIKAYTKTSALVFERQSTAADLKIGTTMRLSAESYYYSPEGDQVGRGPLPPKVGKETKYWALITLQNSTSEVGGVSLTATLAPGVVWTGKTSVSRGREPSYNSANRTLTWQANSLPAHENVQINLELAVIPTQTQVGTIPLLLTAIRASGQDTFINTSVSAGITSLRASLDSDNFAQNKGVRVQ